MDKSDFFKWLVAFGAAVQIILIFLERAAPYRYPWLEIVIPVNCVLLVAGLIWLFIDHFSGPDNDLKT